MHNSGIGIKIKVFGNGARLLSVISSCPNYIAVKNKTLEAGKSVEQTLLDPFFFHSLAKIGVESVEDLTRINFSGIVEKNGLIEIWKDKKKLAKFNMHNMLSEFTLFPLFTISESEFIHQDKDIYIFEKSVGTVLCYEFKVKKFDITDLVFHILDFNNELILIDISVRKCDTTIREKLGDIAYRSVIKL